MAAVANGGRRGALMVTIISKSDGPRKEDLEARKVFEKDRAIITRLADHLTQGAYSATRAARGAVPDPSMPARSSAAARIDTPRPYVKVSANGRVVLVDLDSGRQLDLLGEIRRRDGRTVFTLALHRNGFVSQLDELRASALSDLDGAPADTRAAIDALKGAITTKLELA